MGGFVADAAAVGAVLLALLLVVVMAHGQVRLGDVLAGHRTRAGQGALVAGAVWIACASLGLQISGLPVASDRADTVRGQARRVVDTLRDEAAFAKEARTDPFGATPPTCSCPTCAARTS
ncbi:Sulfatase OS=Streptomyces albaduncus OX=68172 GN=FHS32_001807 PE=4 SV=1 [Streptomyces griseoloalbus]